MTISKNEFKKVVIGSRGLTLVQFKTEWSGACQIISPVFEELAMSYKGSVGFYSVDVEKEAGLEKEYGVMEIPTILFFRNGRVIDHVVGLVPKNVVISKIENALSNHLN
jgi:thioredoxin 1